MQKHVHVSTKHAKGIESKRNNTDLYKYVNVPSVSVNNMPSRAHHRSRLEIWAVTPGVKWNCHQLPHLILESYTPNLGWRMIMLARCCEMSDAREAGKLQGDLED